MGEYDWILSASISLLRWIFFLNITKISPKIRERNWTFHEIFKKSGSTGSKKNEFRHLRSSKKHRISPPFFSWPPNFAQLIDPDPSLGILGKNFIEFRISVRFGSVGIPTWARRPKLPVWTRNSWFRVAGSNLTVDLDSTQNLGSGRVLLGVSGYQQKNCGEKKMCQKVGLLLTQIIHVVAEILRNNLRLRITDWMMGVCSGKHVVKKSGSTRTEPTY